MQRVYVAGAQVFSTMENLIAACKRYLDRAPRDAFGLVGFESDLVVVRPVDPNAGHRGLRRDRIAAAS